MLLESFAHFFGEFRLITLNFQFSKKKTEITRPVLSGPPSIGEITFTISQIRIPNPNLNSVKRHVEPKVSHDSMPYSRVRRDFDKSSCRIKEERADRERRDCQKNQRYDTYLSQRKILGWVLGVFKNRTKTFHE